MSAAVVTPLLAARNAAARAIARHAGAFVASLIGDLDCPHQLLAASQQLASVEELFAGDIGELLSALDRACYAEITAATLARRAAKAVTAAALRGAA